jgi:hypothetical protein
MKKALNEISFWLSAMIFAALMVLAASCKADDKSDADEPKRIHTIESNFATSTYIIEVDSHEYLVNYHGGIYHLESCPCKNK